MGERRTSHDGRISVRRELTWANPKNVRGILDVIKNSDNSRPFHYRENRVEQSQSQLYLIVLDLFCPVPVSILNFVNGSLNFVNTPIFKFVNGAQE